MFTRIFAAHSLAGIGMADEEIRGVYEDAMVHPDPWARVQASCGTRRNLQLLSMSLGILEKGLDDRDQAVVSEAVHSLAKSNALDRWEILQKLLRIAHRSRDCPALQEDAIRALGRASAHHAKRLLEPIAAIDCHKSDVFDVAPVRDETIRALTKMLAEKAER